jgi:hypothetical protein
MSIFTNPASSSTEQAQAYTAAVLGLVAERDPRTVLEQTPAAAAQLVAGVDAVRLAQPERPGKWAIAGVLQHLADSELVFAYRLRMILAHDRPALMGYDQDLWAERLHYDESNAAQALGEFATLRGMNLRLLRRASADDLMRVGIHAERGAESVEHLIRLYAGHDLLHLAQIERIRTAVGAPITAHPNSSDEIPQAG